jgi:ligand-binding SRPBCC domain-containing protein
MTVSGVGLRGTGASGENPTLLELAGAPPMGIEIHSEVHRRVVGQTTTLTDAYVAAGSTSRPRDAHLWIHEHRVASERHGTICEDNVQTSFGAVRR